MQLALEQGAVLSASNTTMPNSQPRVSLPTYVLPLLVTLLLAFLANLSYSLYWAGQMSANQANMVKELGELKLELRENRAENQRLRDQITALSSVTKK